MAHSIDIGKWLGIIGGLAGIYTFLSGLWRRRLRIAVDYTRIQQETEEFHRLTVTNLSDLPITFRYLGPSWFRMTLLGRIQLNFAFDTEDYDPVITVLGPRQSIQKDIHESAWERPSRKAWREKAYLRVGFEITTLGRVVWKTPRPSKDWNPSLRERTILRLYTIYGEPGQF